MLFDYSARINSLFQLEFPTADKSSVGQTNPPIEVREPSKHPFQLVRVLGASLSPASQPNQSTKF